MTLILATVAVVATVQTLSLWILRREIDITSKQSIETKVTRFYAYCLMPLALCGMMTSFVGYEITRICTDLEIARASAIGYPAGGLLYFPILVTAHFAVFHRKGPKQ